MGSAVGIILSAMNIDRIVTHCEVNIRVASRADGSDFFSGGYILENRHKTGNSALNLGFVNNIRLVKSCLHRLGG